MVKKVKTEKIKGIKAAKPGYSQAIQKSTVPVVRKHQIRVSLCGKVTPEEPTPPGGTEIIVGLLPELYQGTTLQLRKFSVKLNGNPLWKFKFGWGNLDKAILGYPPSVFIDFYFGKMYGYGEAELKINKGISFNLVVRTIIGFFILLT